MSEILVVDDDVGLRETICATLEMSGHTTVQAGSGEIALTCLHQHLPDLIILDFHLPGIDGLEFCHALRKLHPAGFLPIILLSGDGHESQLLVRGLEAGAYDFLSKPVHARELRAKVESFLKMKALYETVERQRARLSALNKFQESLLTEQNAQMVLLKRFFSPSVADALLAMPSQKILSYHKRDVTICFVDLRGFTSFADASHPDEVMGVIEEYYHVVCKLALSHGGTISSLAGDGIMLMFNDPVVLPRQMEAAVNFALNMRKDLESCVVSWKAKGFELGFGAGIARGESMIGAVGFDQFVHYTAISTTVNLAARLCSRALAGQVLATAAGLREVDGLLETEKVETLHLKGIHSPIQALNILGWRSPR